MRVYMDISALKRPWDDQTQHRISAETAIVSGIMRLLRDGRHAAVRSPVHDQENALNPNAERAGAVQEWLDTLPLPMTYPRSVIRRGESLRTSGLGSFDALHLAWAEALKADVLVSVDDRFCIRGTKLSGIAVCLPAVAWRALVP